MVIVLLPSWSSYGGPESFGSREKVAVVAEFLVVVKDL